VNPPVPVMAPLRMVVFAATLKVLLVPLRLTALDKVIPRLVFNCAALLEFELFKVMVPLVFVRLESAVRSRIAVEEADGVIEIPPEELSAPATVAVSVPALMVVPAP